MLQALGKKCAGMGLDVPGSGDKMSPAMKTMIHLLVVSVLASSVLLPRAQAVVTAEDKAFLLQHCQIFDDDLGAIPKLATEVQAQISGWLAARDSAAFASFRNTRNYYKYLLKLKPGEAMPFARVPSGWKEAYLLPDELARYQKIVAEHLPCKEVWPDPSRDPFTAEQKELLLNQVHLLPADIDALRQLSQEVQDNLLRWLAGKDLRRLVSLKNSREYYRKLLVKPGLVPMPPAMWNQDYLTPEEYLNYANILDNAPW